MDQVPNSFPDMFAAYAVLWICIVLFMVRLNSRLRKAEKMLGERKN